MSNTPVGEKEFTKSNRRFIWRILSFVVDLTLIVLAGVGCYFALQSSWKKSDLDFHLDQLADKLDTELSRAFVVEDPDRVYIKAIETDKPLEFAWRVYLPKGFKKKAILTAMKSSTHRSAGTEIEEPTHGVARFKIKHMGDYVVCEQNWLGDALVLPAELSRSRESLDFLSRSDIGNAIKQTGKGQVQSFSKDDDVELLLLSLPDSVSNRPGKKMERGMSQIKFSLKDSPR